MTQQLAVELVRDTLMMAFWLCAPLLAIAVVAGILLSILQIVTSVQDSTVATVPRLAILLGALVFVLPWMLLKATTFTTSILGNLARYAR